MKIISTKTIVKSCLTLALLVTGYFTYAQTWTQKADFGGGGRQYCSYFSIGSKGYIGFGNNTQVNDLWEYDPANNTWTQKASIPVAGGRAEMIAFTINGEGYVGMGLADFVGTSNDFFKYDPGTDTWTQIASYPGTWTRGPVAFSIGSKAYVGAGSAGAEFWEYDAPTDTWTQKTDLDPAVQRYFGVSFSIGNKGYIGTGVHGSTAIQDFYEYDPSTDTWTKKADVGGGIRVNSIGFASSTKGYIGTGHNNLGTYYNDLWEYDPTTDTWTQKPNYPGGPRIAGAGFAIGCSCYIGVGTDYDGSTFTMHQDFWEFTACASLPFSASISSTNVLCNGGNNGTATANSSGGASPYSYAWQPGGQTTQSVSGLQAGTYYVTVTDNSNATTSATVTITQPSPVVATLPPDTSVCTGNSVLLTAGGALTYSWAPATGLSSTTGTSVTANPSSSITYTVTASTSDGCSGTANVAININSTVTAAVSITSNPTGIICKGTQVTFTASPLNGGSPTYQWKVNGINKGSGANTYQDASLNNNDTIDCIMTSTLTCSTGSPATSNPVVMLVSDIPVAGTITSLKDTICSGTIEHLSLNGNSGYAQWQSSNNAIGGFSNISGSTGITYSSLMSKTTYYRIVASNGACADTSDVFEETVVPAPVPAFSSSVSGHEVSFNSAASADVDSYYWNFGDSTSSTNPNPSHTYDTTGTFHVCLTGGNNTNCTFTVCSNVAIFPTGLNMTEENNKWNIYPNPFDNEIFINGSSSKIKIDAIQIYDILGRQVIYESHTTDYGSPFTINVSSLSKGIYYLKIKTASSDHFQPLIKE